MISRRRSNLLGILGDLEIAAETLRTAWQGVGQHLTMRGVSGELIFQGGMLNAAVLRMGWQVTSATALFVYTVRPSCKLLV
jgi:hypothetical protein